MKTIRKYLLAIVSAVPIAVAISIAASNPEIITLRLWPFKAAIGMPIWFLALGSFGGGVIVGGIAMLAPLINSNWQKYRLNARIKGLEKEKPSDDPDDDSGDNPEKKLLTE